MESVQHPEDEEAGQPGCRSGREQMRRTRAGTPSRARQAVVKSDRMLRVEPRVCLCAQ